MQGPRGIEYRQDTNGVSWYLYDGLGSVIGEVDASGSVTYTAKHDVYGAVRGSTGTSDSKNRFCGSLGHAQEDATGPTDAGLIYMRARWMDPVTGRFISEDPKRDGINWYAYCESNTTNQVDPTGLFIEDTVKAERDVATLGWAQGKIAQAYGMALGRAIEAMVGAESLAISFNADAKQMFYNIVMNGAKYQVRLDLGGHAGYPSHINCDWIAPGQPGHMILLNSVQTLIDKLSAL